MIVQRILWDTLTWARVESSREGEINLRDTGRTFLYESVFVRVLFVFDVSRIWVCILFWFREPPSSILFGDYISAASSAQGFTFHILANLKLLKVEFYCLHFLMQLNVLFLRKRRSLRTWSIYFAFFVPFLSFFGGRCVNFYYVTYWMQKNL